MSPIVVVFQDDRRLTDHRALYEAAQHNVPLVLLYVYDPSDGLGSAQKVWLHQSLQKLHPDLVIKQGPWAQTVLDVARQVHAQAVYWNENYGQKKREAQQKLLDSPIKTRQFPGNLLQSNFFLRPDSSPYYRVYSPFWKKFTADYIPETPLPAPSFTVYTQIQTDSLDSLHLLPQSTHWHEKILQHWSPGEQGARDALDSFLEHGLLSYHERRDYPGVAYGTSKLSPYLRHGEISATQIIDAVAQKMSLKQKAASRFFGELGWREFAYYLLHHFPALETKNFQSKFNHFPWTENLEPLTAWQQGRTGYPIVDAGMRELYETGWMHNRVRMIVGSFLIKDLLIDWRLGARWFWDTLVDGDIASNAFSWQWVAGSGADAAPYFRIFNPITQGEKFDPQGVYIRKYLPEIAHLHGKELHRPWESGLLLSYPDPIVAHDEARKKALEIFASLKQT